MNEERTLVDAVDSLASQVKELGKGDRYGPGAAERLATLTRDEFREVAGAIEGHAQAVRELAAAVRALRSE